MPAALRFTANVNIAFVLQIIFLVGSTISLPLTDAIVTPQKIPFIAIPLSNNAKQDDVKFAAI